MQDVYGICIENGVSPRYFLDEISDFEIEAILNQYYNNIKRELENTRLVMFSSLAPYSKNLKLTEVLKFEWDNEKPIPVKITKEERGRIKKEAEEILRRINHTTNGAS